MYLVFIFHVSSSSGGRAPWDSVSSGPLMLDLLKALLSLVREKKKFCPATVPLDEAKRSRFTFWPNYRFSHVFG